MEHEPPAPPPLGEPGAPGPQDPVTAPAAPAEPEAPAEPPAPAWAGAPAPLAAPTPPEQTDKVSVAAFVLSLFGVGIAAIPLGVWGIVRTSRGPRRGRGFAIAALVVSAVWAVVATVAVAVLLGGGVAERLGDLASSANPTASAPAATTDTSAEPGSVYWQDVEPGMCFFTPEGEEYDVTVVDCQAEHEAEVIARTTLDGDGTWPGDDAVEEAALAACVPAFDAFVGLPYDASRLEIDFYTTDAEGWESGDRRLICLVYDPDRDMSTVSFKGSKE